jgi:hypothetical protein
VVSGPAVAGGAGVAGLALVGDTVVTGGEALVGRSGAAVVVGAVTDEAGVSAVTDEAGGVGIDCGGADAPHPAATARQHDSAIAVRARP